MTEEPQHPFSSDRPIERKQDDSLGRTGFAFRIAESIRNWKGKDSLVIGLSGPWGSGKTSIKNLILEELNQESQASPHVFEFNPWQWASQGHIMEAFFKELGLALGKQDQGARNRKRLIALNKYIAVLVFGKQVAEDVIPLAKSFLVLLIAFGIILPIVPNSISYLLAAIGSVIFVILHFSTRVADHLREFYERLLYTPRESLKELKEELAGELSTLQQPVLVVLDDIDRLTPDEITEILQIVKSNADFPNVVYLLLYQRDTVEGQLSRHCGVEGTDYLKKIVQVELTIPTIDQVDIVNIFHTELDKVIGTKEKVKELFDDQRWRRVFHYALLPDFKTLRDIKRYMSSLEFQASMLLRGEEPEVNPIDLCLVEVLRQFYPDTYQWLWDSRDTFVFDPGSFDLRTLADHSKKIDEAIETRFPSEQHASGSQIPREILVDLFSFQVVHGLKHEEEWRKALSIRDKTIFTRYFFGRVPSHQLSEREIRNLLQMASNPSKLVEQFKVLYVDGRLEDIIESLPGKLEQIPLEHIPHFVSSLWWIAEFPIPSPVNLFTDYYRLRAHWITQDLFKRIENIDERFQVFKKAFAMAGPLLIPLEIAVDELEEKQRTDHPELSILSKSHAKEFREIALGLIRKAAADGTLKNTPRLGGVLWRWRDLEGDIEPVREWVDKLLAENHGVIHFLNGICGMGAINGIPHWRTDIKEVEEFSSKSAVRETLEKFAQTRPEVEKELGVVAFRAALKSEEKRNRHEGWIPYDRERDRRQRF
jgi:predicted KAP-like P-loop ATPase